MRAVAEAAFCTRACFRACRRCGVAPARWQYLAKPGARPYCSAQPQCVSLPAYESWCPAELKGEAELAPKLPEAFWAKHGPKPHCVIRSPHAPIAMGDW